MSKKPLFIVFVLLITVLPIRAQIKIGFLNVDNSLTTNNEIKAAFKFLKSQTNFSVRAVNYDDILNSQPCLPVGRFSIQQFSILWIHRPDSSEFSNQETNEKFIRALQSYLKSGGKLFLTLDAMKYLNALGFEKVKPQASYADAIDDGYGRKLGLHSFRLHPIFNGLNGGAYIFNPTKDMKTRQVGFFGSSVPQNGKVIAVDWAYITLKEDSKLVVEYKMGKGKVLACGAYTYYGIENNNRAHLELFTKNCLNYLAGKFDKQKKYYWNYSQSKVLPFDALRSRFDSRRARRATLSTHQLSPSKKWPKDYDSMKLTNQTSSNNYWDVAGERMLVMGKEKGGIDEIWAHPFMVLRDYEVGIQFSPKDSIHWLKNEASQIEVRPASFTRIYKIGNVNLTEIITTSTTKPVAVAHYEYRGTGQAKLIVKFKSNMRYMWPYSENALGSIYYAWSGKSNSFLIKNESGDFCVEAGANKRPSQQLIGCFDDFEKVGSEFRGRSTDKFFVSAIAQYDLDDKDNLDFVISATNEGIEKTESAFSSAIKNPEQIFTNAERSTLDFLNHSLMITTPDKNFNEGYKWALIGTNRFFVNTPGLGKSLVAGYSTTERGWDGGHKVNGRPGYAWYFGRDGVWSGLALLDYGDFDKVKSMLEFFNRYQDLSGKIFHELTTSGAVHYDAADSTPLYIILAGEYLHHTGDAKSIKENWSHIKRAIDFCYSTDTDGDHLIENTNVGHGWVEGGGLYTAHTEVYLAACWAAALREASYMTKEIGLNEESKKYNTEFETVRKIIDTNFWNTQTNFLNFSKLKDGKFNPEKTVLAAVPVYFDMLDSTKAKNVIDAYAENYFSSDWGVRILREDSPIFNPRGYHTGSVWPLFTGWSALAEFKYGNDVQGFTHVMDNLLVYKNWELGFVEEVLNGAEYKPSGVCPHQCWSETMVLQPAIEGMLGLKVDALNNKLELAPRFPANWDSVKMERIKIGSQNIDMTMKRDRKKTVYDFKTDGSHPIKINFSPAFPLGTEFEKVSLNRKPVNFEKLNRSVINIQFTLEKSAEIVVHRELGISVLPSVVRPKPNDKSQGFRVLSDKLDGNIYSVEVQGISGTTHTFDVCRNGKIEKINVEFEKSDKKYTNKMIEIKMEH